MTEIELRTFREVDLAGGTVIEAIPSVGLVSTIAATYMITSMDVDQVCALDSEEFPALSMVYAYKPKFPVRIYAEPKSKVSIFLAEVPLSPKVHRPLAHSLLNWARSHKCRQIIALEGLPVPDTGAATRKDAEVWGVGSTDRARAALEKSGIQQLETGIISGVSGVLLNEARWQGFDMVGLLAEARATMPDAFAAARLLEAVDAFLPEIELNLEPLKEEAKSLEKHLQKLRAEARPATAPPADSMFR